MSKCISESEIRNCAADDYVDRTNSDSPDDEIQRAFVAGWDARDFKVKGLKNALSLAASRLEILTARMRGCHEETGKHGLLFEAEEFIREARKAAK